MLVNSSKVPVVLGRFRILPGEKIPTVMLTSEEQIAVERLRGKGILKEKEGAARKKETPAPAPSPKAAKAAEKPAEAHKPVEAPKAAEEPKPAAEAKQA